MKITLLTCAIILLSELYTHGQDLDQRVTIKIAEMPLELLLNELSEQYKVRFSYGHHQKMLEEKVTIQVENQSLRYFLTLLLDRVGLTYKVVGGYVVLRKEQKHTEERGVAEGLSASPTGESESPKKEIIPQSSPALESGRKWDTLVRIQKRGLVALVSVDESVKRVPVPVRLYPLLSPKKNVSAILLGPVFSLDFLHLHMESAYKVNQALHPEVNFSVGSAGLWEISDRMGVEMQLLYRKKEFTLQYLLSTEGQPLGIPEKTEISLASLEVPLGIRFLMLRHSGFALYGSPGLFGSVLLKKQEKTWLDDGRLFPTANMHIPLVSAFLWGGRGALDFSYALSRKFFLSVAPAYQYSINPLKKGTQQIRQGELMVRAGLLIRL
jgi:hypothetical protein